MKLLQAIEAEAEKRCQEARDQAEAEIQRIQEETEQQIRMKRDAAREESERRLAQQENILVSQAETGVQRGAAVAKSELVKEVLSAARDKLARISSSERYADVFRALAEEAIKEMKDDFTAVVRPEDEQLARSTLGQLGAGRFEIATDRDLLGGLVIVSKDGRSRVVNTFDARLERVHEEAILRIAPLLFG